MRSPRLKVSLVLIGREIGALRGMHDVFCRAGARITCLSTIEQAFRIGPGLDAGVILADQVPVELVARTAMALPVKLVVVVTPETELMRGELCSNPQRKRILVLPAPTWDSTLIAAIRRGFPCGEA